MSALESVKAQPGAVRSLMRALEHGRVASAYLFDGPSGVGKELAALALATEIVAGDDPRHPKLLKTIRGAGYMLVGRERG